MMISAWPGRFFPALLALLPGALPPQATPSANSLARALAMFAAADRDRDGRLSTSEAAGIPVTTAVFAAEDANRDQAWSREEFLAFFRHQLLASGQPASPELESEIARLQALKRVESVPEAKKPRCETSARSMDAAVLGERMEQAIADVQAKCDTRQARKEDFQRLRNLVILNGRAPASGAAPSAVSQSTTLQAIDSLEKRSLLGRVPKEEFDSLRRSAVAVQSRPVAPAPANPAPAKPPAGPAEARQRSKTPATEPPKPKPKT